MGQLHSLMPEHNFLLKLINDDPFQDPFIPGFLPSLI